jgi:hypothetical protein
METLTVFDPAMCWSTGVCGSDVNQVLVDLSADVQWLKGRGVQVIRSTPKCFGMAKIISN